MRGKNLLLCFTGMDGTGKTTHALAAKSYLEKKGSRCKYIEFRYQMSILFSFMTIALAWIVLGRKRPVDRYIHENYPLTCVWLFSSIIDYSLYILCRILPIKKNILICDRYVTDTIVRLNFNGVHNEVFTRLLLVIAPRPRLMFHLDAPAQVAWDRKKEDSLEYYVTQRRMYKEILSSINSNYITLDTGANHYQTNRKIYHYIDLIASPE